MTFAEFCALTDADRLVVVEVKVRKSAEGLSWSLVSGTLYSTTFTWGEVVAVAEDGVFLVRDDDDSGGLAGSWGYTPATGVLTLRTKETTAPGAVDGDGNYVHTIDAFVWLGFCDKQRAADKSVASRVIYTPQDASLPIHYHPYLDIDALPEITQAVGDYWVGNVVMSFGTLRFANDGWWHEAFEDNGAAGGYNWHNAEVWVKVGAYGSAYFDLSTVFIGVLQNPRVDDDAAEFDTKDTRLSGLNDIPTDVLSTTDFPNMDTDYEGDPIPEVLGEVYGMQPILVDTDNSTFWKYIAGGHAISDITNVYKDGAALTLTTDYTKSPSTAPAYFTLLADPGNSKITFDAKGVLANGGAYSDNIADIFYWVVTTLCGMTPAKLNAASFAALKAARSAKCGWSLDRLTPMSDFIRLCQTTGAFHFVPLLDGTFAVKYYTSGVTATTPRIKKEDFGEVRRSYKTGSAYDRIVLKYALRSADNLWSISEYSTGKPGWRYGQKTTLTLETMLVDAADAANFAEFYAALVSAPKIEMDGTIPATALDLVPTDKVVLTRAVESNEGDAVTVFNGDVFRILEIKKRMKALDADIVAVSDIQSIGNIICGSCFSCEVCNACQICVASQLNICPTCEKCDAGECSSCQTCFSCETCYLCQQSECASCQNCYTAQGGGCFDCVACMVCDAGQCASCQVCDACQTACYSGQCPTCEKCDAGQCTICQACDACESCDSCEICVDVQA